MSEPLVSIISPIYDEERHIGQMLDSALAQTYSNWELVLVDDGSTDSTVDIVESYADKDPRIRLVKSSHGGLVKAFNRAFAESRGDVLVHCGGDDYMPPDSLASRVEAFTKYPEDSKVAAFSKIRMFWDDDSHQPRVIPRGPYGSRSSPGYSMTRVLARLVFPIPEELVADDPWVGLVLSTQADQINHLPTVSVNYRVHAGNMNPRHKPFDEQNDSLFRHSLALKSVLETDRFPLSAEDHLQLKALWDAANRCHERRPLRAFFTRGLSMADRLAITAAASPALTRVRTRFYGQLSGWRGQ